MAMFSSALNGLRNHHDAVKPTSWRGYVYRFDAPEYNPANPYSEGDEVMYDGVHYVCGSQGQPTGGFDSSRWTRATSGIAYTFQIVFVEDPDFDMDSGNAGNVGYDGHPAYRVKATVAADGTTTYDDPVALVANGSTYDQYDDATDGKRFEIDGVLFTGLLSDSWESGTKEDFDQLAKGGNRW